MMLSDNYFGGVTMLLGVDYYPEQWEAERLEEDLDGIVELGCNVIRIGEFAWHVMEPEEGRFDFSFFDRVIKKAGERGLSIIFGTPTAAPPAWLAHRYPDVLSGAGSWILTLVYPIASMIVGIYLIKVVTDFPDASVDVSICMAVVLFTDLMSIFLANYLERQQIDIRNSIILRSSVKSELENVHTWQEAYAQQRKMTHEFNNQLAVIKGMLEQGNGLEGVLDYINQIQKFPDSSKHLVNTRRPAADVVINQKIYVASSKSIDFRVQLDDLSSVKLPDYALVVVLANIIDNAIEAADRVKNDEERKAFLKIKVTDGVTFINIENYTASPVLIKNNTVITSKGDKTKHGYGLLNVSSIVAQYGGFYTLRYDEGRSKFVVSIQI